MSPTSRAFERKVSLSRCALFFEELWPRLWLVIGVAALFVIASLAGLWPRLSDAGHKLVLVLFAGALIAALVAVLRVPWPSREAAIRRIERRTQAPHRPASSYEDTLTGGSADAVTQRIWRAHKARLAEMLAGLHVGLPKPRTDRRDPFALRALLMLGVVLLVGFAGDSAKDRLVAAFRFGPAEQIMESRLDAWVMPPAYTAKPPIMLADGAQGSPGPAVAEGRGPIEVPDRSLLIVRTSGAAVGTLSLEIKPEAGQPQKVEGQSEKSAADAAEIRTELRRSAVVRALNGRSEAARWSFRVIADQPPKIALTKDPERTPRGSLKLTYKIEDDYGVTSAEARFERLRDAESDPRTSWARADVLKGPRPPLERPPVLALRLPRSNAKDTETSSTHELASHPWAGINVRMTLMAKDLGGNVGRSQPVDLVLPQRRFTKDLAKAVIEQRRKLVEDARYRPLVAKALEALTLEPEGFITDQHVYLGLRSAYHRLLHDRSRAGLKSVIEQLWHVALRIEDGAGLTEAERRLKDIQDRLSKAIEQGAPEAEIQSLMQELRQALSEFLEQLARQAEGQQMDFPEGLNPNQIVRPEDLERMLNNLENMARQGSRDMAQEMLSQLRDLLDQLQSGRMADMGRQSQQMMQMMDQFGDLIGNQQRLYDDTFGEQRRQGEHGQQGQRKPQGQKGQGEGRQGQQPAPGQPGQQFSPGELGERQRQLRDQLGRLQQGLRDLGMRPPGQFDGAEQSMGNAQQALEQGDLETATREQSRALEQLRQGSQSMAGQMLRQMPSRFGRGPADDAPRDPFGRPQRTEGPDAGTSVKVPDEIDVQRAREILEELRRRLGEPSRPLLELDYIERLLRRF